MLAREVSFREMHVKARRALTAFLWLPQFFGIAGVAGYAIQIATLSREIVFAFRSGRCKPANAAQQAAQLHAAAGIVSLQT